MRMLTALVLGFAIVFATVSASAQSPSSEPATKQDQADSADLAALRQAAQDFESAFNKGKATQVAAHWTEDGEYVAETGQVFSGRKAIRDEYKEFFAANKGQQIKIVIDALRLLSDSAAIEDGHAILDPTPTGAPAFTKYTAVHVKVDGKWLMSTVRDERIETPSTYHHVADLEWLIGAWTAEEHGVKLVSECRWVANKSFIQRTHTATHPDQTTSSGVQLIGFNQQVGHIQSWDFSSDGGHAVGVWTPNEGGWQAEVSGTTGDGVSTKAVNILTRIDDNAYVWQSVQRTLGDLALPDSDEIVLRRSTNE